MPIVAQPSNASPSSTLFKTSPAQVHFYFNRSTGAIDYGYDYKASSTEHDEGHLHEGSSVFNRRGHGRQRPSEGHHNTFPLIRVEMQPIIRPRSWWLPVLP